MSKPRAGAKRVTATLESDTYERLVYWSEKKGISINQFMADAIVRAIAWENQDYPLSTLEQARLNQLIDQIAALSSNVKSMEGVIVSGLDSLLGLTRGDNYLLDYQEDGEL